MKAITILILACNLYSYTLNDVSRFILSYPNNKLTAEEVYFFVWQCKAFTIHPLMALTILEKESSLVTNPVGMGRYNFRHHRAFGYNLIASTWTSTGKYYQFGFFTVQCHSGIKALRKSIDRWERKKYKLVSMSVNDGEKQDVDNVLDYLLLRYTPYSKCITNYKKIFAKFEARWNEVNK